MKIRKHLMVFIYFAVIVLCWPFQAGAVVQWTKNSNNPVLTPGTSGAWDDYAVFKPAVIKDGTTYKMWYSGIDDIYTSGSTLFETGYATSPDGVVWTRGNGGNPVLSPGASGEWDHREAAIVSVVKEISTYKMWYSGSDDDDGTIDSNENIGYATSDDGVTWTKYNIIDTGTPYADSDPVLKKGTINHDWDGGGITYPTVIIDNDAPPAEKYKMWYVGYDHSQGTGGIGYAYSSDGITWIKYDNPNTTSDPFANSDPVIKKGGFPFFNWGPLGAWNERSVSTPTVIKEDSVYRMWLKASNSEGVERIGYYYSVDGINWTQYRGNPVVMEGDTALDDFDEDSLFFPVVIKDGTTYKMWYAGAKDCEPCLIQIGYATSPAYSGSLAINKMRVSTDNRSGGMRTYVEFDPEGPGPLDFTELKVEGPNGFSHIFSDSDYWNDRGYQNPYYLPLGMPTAGTYTFTAKTNNGLTVTNSLNFTNPAAIPVYGTGAGGMDMQIKVGSTTFYNRSYIGVTTPTFRFKPADGPNKYYRAQIFNYAGPGWTVWVSNFIQGTNAVGGYIEIPVPANALVPGSAYKWRTEIFDTDNRWTAHNRSVSDLLEFYTGTRDDATNPDFISWTRFHSERSFLSGERAAFGFRVINLAPWDIDTADGKFSVLNEDLSTLYNFGPYNSCYNTPSDFYYWGGFSGIPNNATSPGYTFVATESFSGNYHFESVIKPYADVPTLPQVTHKDMLPEDNTYFASTIPTFSWISKGEGYKYRVFIITWTGHEIYTSSRQNGLPDGQTMSETIPFGVLRELNPYVWWVEIFDTNLFSRTRSNRLTFMTGLDSFLEGSVRFIGAPCAPGMPCQVPPGDGPYPNYDIVVYDNDGVTIVSRTSSDTNGDYKVVLTPGDYIIYTPNGPFRQKINAFTIVEGETTTLDLVIDTGIRTEAGPGGDSGDSISITPSSIKKPLHLKKSSKSRKPFSRLEQSR